MNFHIIMPFHREHLLPTLKDTLRKLNVIWHPVCDPDEINAFYPHVEDWILPVQCKYLTIPGDQAYRKVNDFIETYPIVNNDFYGFLGDDDMYAPYFIEKVKKQTSKIVICSMSRGDNHTTDNVIYNWPPIPIFLHKLEDIRVANIDFCQMIVKGEILKQTKFRNCDVCDDGVYAEYLRDTWPEEIIIFSEIGVFKNYYEPNRYNDVNTMQSRVN